MTIKTKKTYAGKLFVISAPSGSGKTTLCHKLFSMNIKNIKRSISVTTRNPRKGEKAGRDYFFISHEEFETREKRGKFLESAKVLGNFYGTPRESVDKKTKAGKDVILSIDVQGAMQIKKRFKQAVLIFILPPSFASLKSRLKNRSTENTKEIAKRLNLAKRELKYLPRYDYKIVNQDLNEAAKQLKAIISAERCKVKNV